MALRDLGWTGFVQVVTFMAILAIGYIYIWRKGVLDWGPDEVRARMAARARKVSDGTRTAA
jgi:hypothetical protein